MSLLDDPFDYAETKDGKILIRRGGRLVVTVAGGRAQDLASRLARADDEGRQQLLARATGNYRRGNERGGRA
ncbi:MULTISPECIES: hypothetical protein [Arthrobacter]|uniref:Uncharacterized protein n=1 Tax=Arthrobacter woluwensis TaxID=156980 RepID=A0A1H4MI43_9MICC|nr:MULTISPECIES: hypothetical protein [Arthrobacter]PSS43811.1 hypothetical protein C6401_10355 [Arthrobacter woluwensis]SEB82593.1 hypothetical protein SAMN04489745_1353 [Arthrobacter woluwensis]